MPDTGAPWNIPYAAPSDLVRDWPALSEDVAEAVADGLDEVSVVRQVLSTVKTDTFSASVAQGGVSGDVTGLTQAITPDDNTNKVLVIAQVSVGRADAAYVTLYRDGTAIAIGDAAGNRQRIGGAGRIVDDRAAATVTLAFLDSPATASEVIYSVRVGHDLDSTATVYVNRSGSDSNISRFGRSASTITVIEVTA
jgi:hypothetical protein